MPTTVLDIPNPVLAQIFQYLSPFSLPQTVCKQFHQACNSDTLWVFFLEEHFPQEHESAEAAIPPSPKKRFIELATTPQIERKAMNLGRHLHLLGYPCHTRCGLSPSGCYWRYSLSYDNEDYNFSNGGTALFEIPDAAKLSDDEILKQFLELNKWKTRSPTNIEKLHMRWYEQVFKSIGRLDIIYEVADWYTTPDCVPVVCRTRLPHNDKTIPFWEDVESMYQTDGKLHPFLEW
eukprot:CAMPEP_0168540194 /NCGR_PEP_ID=MMETSP0413-20121227/142_1 /TAXON_ID=136452 /ORGANISM="Filamoeba nolandi, Strain NC-AS-23-1" /LENGTH=233 /DNA_ID=CAMNT_0008569903 /DNA_START=53 /DNA_END=751 /DNA_ORIENTATION=-